jgi:iron(II)-dependent oxidoreductase
MSTGWKVWRGVGEMARSKKGAFIVILVAFASLMLALNNSESLPSIAATVQPTVTVGHDTNGAEMIYVPAGKFQMGTTSETIHRLCTELGPDHLDKCTELLSTGDVLSAYTAEVSSFWIDRYEVTVAQYQNCVKLGSCTDIDLSQTPDLASPDNKPQVAVTWYQAIRFCNYRGARLPTEEEWQFAASGPENNAYPWGNSFVQANYPVANSTHPIGGVPGDRSWIGVYDMAGNVAEWVENLYLPYSRNVTNWSGFSEVDRVSRGGSWGSGGLLATTFMRTRLYPDEVYPTQGFRCARSSPPGTRQ